MAGPITISIDSNVSGALKGVSDVNSELEKTQTSLKDTATGGTKSTEQLTQDFQQQQSIVHETFTKQTEEAALSNREVNSIQKETLKTSASSIAQTVAQSAQGINGTAESAVSALGNMATGVAALSGNVGVALGATGLALLVSVITGAFQSASESEADFEAAVSSLTGKLEKAKDGKLSIDDITSSLQALSQQTDKGKTSLDDLFQVAKDSGHSAKDLAQAYAGQTDKLKELDAAAHKQLDTQRESDLQFARGPAAIKTLTAAQQKYTDYLDTAVKTNKAAEESTDNYKQAIQGLSDANKEAAETTVDYTNANKVFGDIGSKIAAEQTAVNEAAATASTKAKKTIVANNVETLSSFETEQASELSALLTANASKIGIYEKFGKDAGKAIIKDVGNNPTLLAALANASPADVAKIEAQYGAAGTAAGTNLQKQAEKVLDAAKPTIPPLKPGVDPSEYDKFIRNVQNTKTVKTIQLNFVDRNGKAMI